MLFSMLIEQFSWFGIIKWSSQCLCFRVLLSLCGESPHIQHFEQRFSVFRWAPFMQSVLLDIHRPFSSVLWLVNSTVSVFKDVLLCLSNTPHIIRLSCHAQMLTLMPGGREPLTVRTHIRLPSWWINHFLLCFSVRLYNYGWPAVNF